MTVASARPQAASPKRRLDEPETMRLMHRALVLYFLEEMAQSEIAGELGVSHATVNRLIKKGRALGLVEIRIKSPVEHLFEIEQALKALGDIDKVIVVPTLTDSHETVMQSVGRAAAGYLLEVIKDGQVLTITGGKGVSALVDAIETVRRPIEIVPATGLVQGHYYTDVNHIGAKLAEKLGGQALQIHAPLFAETEEMRGMLHRMNSVRAVFDKARSATVAAVGIGSILTEDSSYYDLHPATEHDRREIEGCGAKAELVAHLLDGGGKPCNFALNRTLVTISLDELRRIPTRIGVAAGPTKALPILSVLRGNHLNALVTDEATARRVLELAEETAG